MSSNKVKPLGNRILIKRSEPKTTKGGILIPESSKEKPKQGLVIATGPGKYNESGVLESCQIKVGDKVLFGSYAGTEVKVQGIEDGTLVMSEDEVLAVIEE